MKQKIIVMVSSILLTLGLVSCGKSSSVGNTPAPPVAEQNTETHVAEQNTTTPEPTATPTPLPETLFDRVGGKLYVGDEFTLGTYEQDNDLENGKEDIEWVVLSKDGDGYICISKCVLDAQYFSNNNQVIPNSWSDSHLREWLNNTFLLEAFSDMDKMNLSEMQTRIYEWESLDKYVMNTKTVSDKVRVINYGELDDNPSCVKVTEYAKAQGASFIDDGTREHENCSDGWCMMSYHVDYVKKYMSQLTSITGWRALNLAVATYEHDVPPIKSWAYGKTNFIGVGKELLFDDSFNSITSRDIDTGKDCGKKVGVRPVIKIQFGK